MESLPEKHLQNSYVEGGGGGGGGGGGQPISPHYCSGTSSGIVYGFGVMFDTIRAIRGPRKIKCVLHLKGNVAVVKWIKIRIFWGKNAFLRKMLHTHKSIS